MTLSTEVPINLADDPELVDWMVEAGFTQVFVGIETPDEDSLAECNKLHDEGHDLVEDAARRYRYRAGSSWVSIPTRSRPFVGGSSSSRVGAS